MQRINENPGAGQSFGTQQRGVQGDPMQMSTGIGKMAGDGGFDAGQQSPSPFAASNGPVGSFNQRKANAQSLYGPGGQGMAMNFGGSLAGQDPMSGPMQPAQPPRNGGGFMGPRQPQLQGERGFRGDRPPSPMGPPPNPGVFGPPQPMSGQGGPSGMNPQAIQQLLSQPGFMEVLQRYMQQGFGGGARQGGRPQAQAQQPPLSPLAGMTYNGQPGR